MSKPSDSDATDWPRTDSSLDLIALEDTSPQPSQLLLHRLWHLSIKSARGSINSFQQSIIKTTGWFQVDIAASLAALPIPLATMPVLTALQVTTGNLTRPVVRSDFKSFPGGWGD